MLNPSNGTRELFLKARNVEPRYNLHGPPTVHVSVLPCSCSRLAARQRRPVGRPGGRRADAEQQREASGGR